jgi:hypothetical protein
VPDGWAVRKLLIVASAAVTVELADVTEAIAVCASVLISAVNPTPAEVRACVR